MRVPCPLCRADTPREHLAEARWLSSDIVDRLTADHPNWKRRDGACPACVQQALLEMLTERGEAALQHGIQASWPLDAEAAFGAIPTPLRLHADPRFTGKGITIALVDSGFFPHPDLVRQNNRIRAWVDAGSERLDEYCFGRQDRPRWPGYDRLDPHQWHGLMTSVTAAGNGWLSHGLYRGLASDSDLVLVQARDERGHISNGTIARALWWIERNLDRFAIRVVSVSVAGDEDVPGADDVNEAISRLCRHGVVVVAAAGNDGLRRLVPPATAPLALTVGGIDDHNSFDPDAISLWHSNYGDAANGAHKPELVAPSIWIVAPILLGTTLAEDAKAWFARRASQDEHAEEQIRRQKLVTPYYQHVEGTSFAAPIVASVAACMLQACPGLSSPQVRSILTATARAVPGVGRERQGAGVLQAGPAVNFALAHGALNAQDEHLSSEGGRVRFTLHDVHAGSAAIVGSWNNWRQPAPCNRSAPGVWSAAIPQPEPGRYAYKFLLDGHRWLTDPLNPRRLADSFGGWNSLLEISAGGSTAANRTL
jgi:serine protease AprX